jgi:hypothetical protein
MKRIILVIICGLIIRYAQAGDEFKVQEPSLRQAQHSFLDKVFVGGNLGLNFSSNFTLINISPNVGYMITEKWAAGIGVIYQYRNDQRSPGLEIKTNDYGFNLFTRYQVFQPIFVQVEYEYLNFEFATGLGVNNEVLTDREGYNSLFLGGGLAQPIGRNASFNITVLYNVLYDNTEDPRPYGSPLVIRAGAAVGF